MTMYEFKEAVKAKGGIWESGDIRFTGFCDGYSAVYHPYTDHSTEDCAIGFSTVTGEFEYIPPKEWHKRYMAI